MRQLKKNELLRYLLVGGVAVLIDTVVYILLSGYAGVPASWSKRISFASGAVWSFFANKFFTFRQPEKKLAEPLLFAVIYLLGFLLNSFTHDYTFYITGSKPVSFVMATGLSTVFNYAGQKWVVFRKKIN